eukprot:4737437-Pyramimonas_sp.AAC.1
MPTGPAAPTRWSRPCSTSRSRANAGIAPLERSARQGRDSPGPRQAPPRSVTASTSSCDACAPSSRARPSRAPAQLRSRRRAASGA